MWVCVYILYILCLYYLLEEHYVFDNIIRSFFLFCLFCFSSIKMVKYTYEKITIILAAICYIYLILKTYMRFVVICHFSVLLLLLYVFVCVFLFVFVFVFMCMCIPYAKLKHTKKVFVLYVFQYILFCSVAYMSN